MKFENNHINVKGPKGELARDVHPLVSVAIEDVDGAEQVVLTIDDLNDKQKKANYLCHPHPRTLPFLFSNQH